MHTGFRYREPHSECIGCVRKFTLKCHTELRASLFLWRVDKSRRVAMRIGDVLHFSVISLVLKDDRGRTCLPRNLYASARSCGYGMGSPRRHRVCRKPAWLLFRLQESTTWLWAAGLRITKKEITLPKVENSVLGFAGYRAQKRRVGNAKNMP